MGDAVLEGLSKEKFFFSCFGQTIGRGTPSLETYEVDMKPRMHQKPRQTDLGSSAVARVKEQCCFNRVLDRLF